MDRQTDSQTDGIAVASTAPAMQALRRAVKTTRKPKGKVNDRSWPHNKAEDYLQGRQGLDTWTPKANVKPGGPKARPRPKIPTYDAMKRGAVPPQSQRFYAECRVPTSYMYK